MNCGHSALFEGYNPRVDGTGTRNSDGGDLVPSPGPADAGNSLPAAPTDVVAAFFADKDAKTIRAYKRHLEDFRLWLNVDSIDDAARMFFGKGPGQANLLAMNWKAHLKNKNYAPNSVNAHLVALRSLVKVARLLGAIGWSIEIQNVPSEAYRDTSGPGIDLFKKVIAELAPRMDPMGIRDRVLLCLLYDVGLRRDEAATLDLEHVDWAAHRLWVKAKKRKNRVAIPINVDLEADLKLWVAARGEVPGALFRNYDPAEKSKRLSDRSIGRITHKYGLGNAHGLRHLAITEVLKLTNGNVVDSMKFSRHKDPKTLMIYDDNRRNVSGEISEKLSKLRQTPAKGTAPEEVDDLAAPADAAATPAEPKPEVDAPPATEEKAP